MSALALGRRSKYNVPTREYNLESQIDLRIEIRPSPIAGMGMFACAPIEKGEIVIVWGGIVMTKEDVEAGRYRKGTLSAIAENLWLGDALDGEDYAADDTNHSCDPNLWMKDEVTLMARRRVAAGEELTADYMMWEANEAYRAAWQCACGSPLCRRVITGRDWRLPELQEAYRNHFSPFLNERIEKEIASSRACI